MKLQDLQKIIKGLDEDQLHVIKNWCDDELANIEEIQMRLERVFDDLGFLIDNGIGFEEIVSIFEDWEEEESEEVCGGCGKLECTCGDPYTPEDKYSTIQDILNGVGIEVVIGDDE